MAPRARALLLLALLPLAACQRPQVALELVFDVVPDGGTDAGCAAFADLACVNFIKFQLDSPTMPTQCLKVQKRLTTLCDVRDLATGAELFRPGQDDTVTVKIWGLRVFPATSCEINPECEPKVLFSGQSDAVRAGGVNGGTLPLHITSVAGCGPREEYLPRIGGKECAEVCTNGAPVCVLAEGCVCTVDADAGAPRSGNWALEADGGG
jgi:hypothetical protein